MKIVNQDFNISEAVNESKELINSYLDKYLELRYPQVIWESMRYTALSDGKRIRPILVIEATKACGGKVENVLPVACAIEMVHAQSLIHDDLPCMDNDDFRRGRPTNHKQFNEAIAVLAGDALLAYAPQVVIQHTPEEVDRKVLIKVLEELAIASGPLGIVGGQVVDIQSENKEIELAAFNYIHTHKTGALFKFAVRAGALIAEVPEDKLEAITTYGQLIGYAFQIADDILDVVGTKESLGKTPGKDSAAKKNTHVTLYGLEESVKEVENLCSKAQKVLFDYNLDTPLLLAIAGQIAKKVIKK